MGSGVKLFDALISLSEDIRIGMEESGADNADKQLDYLNDLVDVAIATKDRRKLTQLGIMIEYLLDELAEVDRTAS